MSVWKLRRRAHETADGVAADTDVFVAPGPDQTYQNSGTLKLTAAEAAELKAKLEAPAEEKPFSNDLTAQEYNRLMEFLMEWAVQDTEALYLADIVKNKFGASARRRAGG